MVTKGKTETEIIEMVIIGIMEDFIIILRHQRIGGLLLLIGNKVLHLIIGNKDLLHLAYGMKSLRKTTTIHGFLLLRLSLQRRSITRKKK